MGLMDLILSEGNLKRAIRSVKTARKRNTGTNICKAVQTTASTPSIYSESEREAKTFRNSYGSRPGDPAGSGASSGKRI